MLSIGSARFAVSFARTQFRRNLATSTLVVQKASDPIQQMFVDKIREYADKKSKAGGKLVGADEKVLSDLNKELENVAKQYGGQAGEDMTKFPDIKFTDSEVTDIDLK